MKNFFISSLIFLFLNTCGTISKKVDNVTQQEEEKLNKFLKKTESELKIEFGKPDSVEVTDKQNKVLVYYDSKFKIKCERRFEIDKKNRVIVFRQAFPRFLKQRHNQRKFPQFLLFFRFFLRGQLPFRI